MTTISTENARHVADNPDGCDASDIKDFLEYVGDGDRPAPQAAALFPACPDERVEATIMLRNYCKISLKARCLRSKGEIQKAIDEESKAEQIYLNLPFWAKW